MDTFARDFPGPLQRNHAPTQLRDLVQALGLSSTLGLADPGLGTPITTSRSSWVRRVCIGAIDCHIKTYVYQTLTDRWRGTLRNTGPFCPSRAAREAQALHWLAQHGFAVPPVIGVVERRRLGWVATAILVTASWPGEPLDRLLPRLEPAQQHALAAAVGAFLDALHVAGFRDGNCDLRNLMAVPADGGYALTKIDSPRFRVTRPGRRDDRSTRADWARLLPQLEQFGLAGVALRAAGRAPLP